MRKKHTERLLIILVFAIFFTACNHDDKKQVADVIKTFPNDPFLKTTISSQFFDVTTEKDTVIEGERGTVIFIPKDAFKDKDGNIVNKDIKLELAEPESLDEILLSNLTSESDNNLLESQGMFYINATSNGEQLMINEENPIYVEIPTTGSKEDLMVFKGVRGEDGRMNWVNPQPVDKYLIPVDMSTLDFYPKGFEYEVKNGMPFRSYKAATTELIDSLYYSLSTGSPMSIPPVSGLDTTIMESGDTVISPSSSIKDASEINCGIDPAIIKVIRGKKFKRSLISTREFEKRLKTIFETCNNSILEIYITNLDKNLWELDEMAAEKLGVGHDLYNTFRGFSMEKLTNVKKSDKFAKKLSNYYNRQLGQVKKELADIENKAIKEKEKEDKIAQTTKDEYKRLLQKREKYRMDKFGFKLTELGWYNGAVYVEDLGKFILEITVSGGDQFDRVHTYIVNPKIQSLFAMISDNKILFNRGYQDDKHLLMWKHQDAQAVVIAYKGNDVYFEKQVFKVYTEKSNLLTFKPILITEKELRKQLRADIWRKNENKIKVDLEYQAFFERERKRQARLKQEAIFMRDLHNKAFPCCKIGAISEAEVE